MSAPGHLPLDDDEIDALRFEDRERKRMQSRGCVCGLPGCFGVHECSYREDDEALDGSRA